MCASSGLAPKRWWWSRLTSAPCSSTCPPGLLCQRTCTHTCQGESKTIPFTDDMWLSFMKGDEILMSQKFLHSCFEQHTYWKLKMLMALTVFPKYFPWKGIIFKVSDKGHWTTRSKLLAVKEFEEKCGELKHMLLFAEHKCKICPGELERTASKAQKCVLLYPIHSKLFIGCLAMISQSLLYTLEIIFYVKYEIRNSDK